MINWLRLYHEVCTDPKWPAVARNAQTNQGTVLSVWIALLTYASQQPERGSIKGFCPEDYDVQFGYDDGTVQRVIDAMEKRGIISNGRLAAWEKRQPKRERDDMDCDIEQSKGSQKKKGRGAAVNYDEPSAAIESQEGPRATNKSHQEPSAAIESQEGPQDKDKEKEKDKDKEKKDFKGVMSTKPAPTLPPDGGVPPMESFDLSPEIKIRTPSDNCPHERIVELYHEILPGLPHVKVWKGADESNLRARWREDKARQNLGWWRGFFEYVARSDFLTGRTHGRDGKPFFASLGWIVKASNFSKILNGNYNHEAQNALEQVKRMGYDEAKRQLELKLRGGQAGTFGPLRDVIDVDGEVQST